MNDNLGRAVCVASLIVFAALGPAVSQPVQSARVLTEQGLKELEKGGYREALAHFRAAAKLSPGDAGIAFHIGVTEVRLGKYRDALPPLRRALAEPSHAEEARFLLGASLFQIREYTEAAKVLDSLRQSKYAADGLYMIEESCRRTRNAEGAKRAFAELAQRFPESAQLHKLMGIAYDAGEDWDNALAEFGLALKADPQMAEMRFAIGLIHLKKQDQAAARKWLEAELAVSPCYAASHFYLGEIDRRADRLAEAAVAYRKAVGCDAAYVDARLGLGTVLKKQRKLPEAVRQFEEAARLAPGDRRVQFQLATALRDAGQTERANAEFARLRQLPGTAGETAAGRGQTERDETVARLETLIK